MSAPKQPHPLGDLLLTIILPSLVLEFLSKPERLGPMWALVVALLLPLGFGIYCFAQKRGLNFFSVLGLIAIIVTGGLGLLNLNAVWFAAKEAAFPVFLGLAFPLSHRFGKPLVSELLLNPQVINHTLLQRALNSADKQAQFQRLLGTASLGMAGASLFSAAANSALAIYLIGDKAPASPEYVKAIGTLNWGGFIIIGIPLVAVTFGLLLWLLRRIQQLTGLDRDDLLNPGATVRRQVG
jgi:hypothetical protein